MSSLKDVLDMTGSVMDVIKQVADTPGINLLPYASTVSNAIGLMQAALKVGVSITPYVEAVKGTFSEGAAPPTQADMDALDKKLAELRVRVHAPLPPREPGEPE